ncbi:MAG: sugar transferase [Granulosicoccus sp.]
METGYKQVVDTNIVENVTSVTGYAPPTETAQSPAREELPLVQLTPTVYTRFAKDALDRTAALCALFFVAIPMLVIGVIVLMSMGRPILFQQRRVGLNGRVFNVLKFRTMGQDRRLENVSVEQEDRLTHKTDADPRHTAVGKVLRRYSVDELPQLVNILRGDMSIVGPRPELETIVNTKYPKNLDQRHLVRPGLTGLWQISARGEGPMHKNGEWDLTYVEQISLLTDIKIICKTPFAMFGRNKGG